MQLLIDECFEQGFGEKLFGREVEINLKGVVLSGHSDGAMTAISLGR
jgi:hypothetical protein